MFKTKRKLIFSIISITLGSMLVAYTVLSSIFGTFNFTKWKQTQDLAVEDTQNYGLVITTDEEENTNSEISESTNATLPDAKLNVTSTTIDSKPLTAGSISLTSAAIAPTAYSDYGISAQAETAQLITVSVTPSESEVTDFTFSCSWLDPNSSWATGKDINNYFTVTQSSTNKLQATATCIQAFGEPIVITCTYDFDASIKATCQADYLKAITDVTITGFYAEEFNDVGSIIKATPTYGVGTITGTFTPQYVYAELSDEAYAYLRNSDYYYSWLGAANDDPSLVQSTAYGFDGKTPYYTSSGTTFELDQFIDDGSDNYFSIYRAEANKYIVAAFNSLAKNTTNQLRCAVEYTYTYDTYSKSGTAYTDYGSINEDYFVSSLLTVTGVSFNNENLIYYPD